MPNIKLTIAYDGTDFHGWQVQPEQATIQGLLSETLAGIVQHAVTLNGAGRTDAGVHAWGQVASFTTECRIELPDLVRAANAKLPPAIRVRSAEQVATEFHARWDAAAKTYRYLIDRGQVSSPFSCRYALHHPYPLDFAAMREAAQRFEGEHDFTTFAASSGSEEEDRERTVVRTIERSEIITGAGDVVLEFPRFDSGSSAGTCLLIYVVRGKSFLRHMVRRMVGTLLEVGRGRLAPTDIDRLIELRDRSRSGPTVPPRGLCLASVEYPGDSSVTPGEQEPDGLQ